MGFFKDFGKSVGSLFKKKPGGTVIGNAIRSGLSASTGGVLGTGKNVLPVEGAVKSEVENVPFDLGKFIKLPTVDVGTNQEVLKLLRTVVFGVLGLVGVSVFFKMLTGGKKSRYSSH